MAARVVAWRRSVVRGAHGVRQALQTTDQRAAQAVRPTWLGIATQVRCASGGDGYQRRFQRRAPDPVASKDAMAQHHQDVFVERQHLQTFGPAGLGMSAPTPLLPRNTRKSALDTVLQPAQKDTLEEAAIVATALLDGDLNPPTWIKLMHAENYFFRTPRVKQNVNLWSRKSTQMSNFFLNSVWATMTARNDFTSFFQQSQRFFPKTAVGKADGAQQQLTGADRRALTQARKQNLDGAFDAWSAGKQPNPEIFNLLLFQETRTADTPGDAATKAEERLKSCSQANASALGIVMDTYARGLDFSGALDAFERHAEATGATGPDGVSLLNHVLRSSIEARQAGASAPSNDVATRVLRICSGTGLRPNTEAFNLAIAAATDLADGLKVYREMRHCGVVPNAATFNTILAQGKTSLEHRNDHVELAKQVWTQLDKTPAALEAEPYEAAQLLAAIVLPGGQRSKQRQLVREVHGHAAAAPAVLPHLSPDYWDVVIEAAAGKSEDPQAAVELYRTVPDSVLLHRLTYERLLALCCTHVGGEHVALEILKGMKSRGHNGMWMQRSYNLTFSAGLAGLKRAHASSAGHVSRRHQRLVDDLQEVLHFAERDSVRNLALPTDLFVKCCLAVGDVEAAAAAALKYGSLTPGTGPANSADPVRSVLLATLKNQEWRGIALHVCEQLSKQDADLPNAVSPEGLDKYMHSIQDDTAARFRECKSQWKPFAREARLAKQPKRRRRKRKQMASLSRKRMPTKPLRVSCGHL
eukprot:m.10870 g.10870  ORF g.10870 m.10870 type:complete len:755 (+) comp3868_c0_seq1:31-2295(+)